jgi:hypothetical protein
MPLHLLDHDVVLTVDPFDFQFQQFLGHCTGFENGLKSNLSMVSLIGSVLGPYKMAGILPSRRRTREGPFPTAFR